MDGEGIKPGPDIKAGIAPVEAPGGDPQMEQSDFLTTLEKSSPDAALQTLATPDEPSLTPDQFAQQFLDHQGGANAIRQTLEKGLDAAQAENTQVFDQAEQQTDAVFDAARARAAETGAAETGAAETGAAETGAAETGAAETGAAETGAAENSVAEVGKNPVNDDEEEVSTEDRMKAIEQKIIDGSASDDEENEFNEYQNGKNRQNELAELNKTLLEKGLSPEQMARRKELKDQLAAEASENDPNDLTSKLVEQLADGSAFKTDENGVQTGELTKEASDAIDELRKAEIAENLKKMGGLNPDEAKAQATDILKKSADKEKKTLIEKKVKEELQLLMALEMQALQIPQRLNQFEKAKDTLKARVKSKQNQVNTQSTNKSDVKERTELYGMYNQLAAIDGQIAQTMNSADILNAQYKETMVKVRRMLGTGGRMDAFLNLAEAKFLRLKASLKTDIDSMRVASS